MTPPAMTLAIVPTPSAIAPPGAAETCAMLVEYDEEVYEDEAAAIDPDDEGGAGGAAGAGGTGAPRCSRPPADLLPLNSGGGADRAERPEAAAAGVAAASMPSARRWLAPGRRELPRPSHALPLMCPSAPCLCVVCDANRLSETPPVLRRL